MIARRKSNPCAAKAYPTKPTVAVGAVVFKAGSVLLVKRADPPSEGIWAIPGGSVELGETLQQAAEREIKEETGVEIRAGAPIYVFDVVDRDREGRVRYHYVIADVIAQYVAGSPAARDDALDARWVAPCELDRLEVSQVTLDLLRNRLRFGSGEENPGGSGGASVRPRNT